MSAPPDADEALEKALRHLADLRRRERRPERRDVREVLVGLGELLLRGEPSAASRLEEARPLLVGWRAGAEAVASELALACAEHVHSVDPRYLELPGYDLDYTLAARERLRARTSAAGALGIPVPPALERAVAEADGRLEAFLARRSGRRAP